MKSDESPFDKVYCCIKYNILHTLYIKIQVERMFINYLPKNNNFLLTCENYYN